MSTPTLALEMSFLSLSAAVGGELVDGKLHLAKTDFIEGRDLKVEDLTEADFTGYVAIVLGTPTETWINELGDPCIAFPQKLFSPTDALEPNTIFGWYITDSAGTALLVTHHYDEPRELVNPEDGLLVTPIVVIEG